MSTAGASAPQKPRVAAAPAPGKPALPETIDALPFVSSQEIKKEANPFTEKDWRMLVYAWSGLALRIILILGAFFTVYQFLAAREKDRIERSFEMVELWEKPEYQAAQRAVKNRIEGLAARYGAILADQPTSAERSVVMGRIGQEAMTADGGTQPVEQFREDFDRVVYFLNRIAFCVEGNICSREVIDAYFGDYTRSFWSYFGSYVEGQRRTMSTTYARPIENYVRSVAPGDRH